MLFPHPLGTSRRADFAIRSHQASSITRGVVLPSDVFPWAATQSFFPVRPIGSKMSLGGRLKAQTPQPTQGLTTLYRCSRYATHKSHSRWGGQWVGRSAASTRKGLLTPTANINDLRSSGDEKYGSRSTPTTCDHSRAEAVPSASGAQSPQLWSETSTPSDRLRIATHSQNLPLPLRQSTGASAPLY
jgi:hypothetical protein